ncbi:hypothetical protein ACM55F_11635 [Flavobacterium sp. XS2P12]|uniref:hypothetical protein n=1 Tax=Flavobacterium melibiosi TaxID=3398734 RepID=UPI003A845154
MKKILFICFIQFFTTEIYAQKSNKISLTTEKKSTNNGESILEDETINVSKSKLLKNNCDTTKTYFVIYDFKKGEYEKGLVKPKVDRPIVYKITNINRLAFDVKVNTKDEVVAETDWFTSSEDLKKITVLLNEANAVNQVKIENTIENAELAAIKKKDDSKEKEVPNEIAKDVKILNDLSALKLQVQQKTRELVNKNNDKKTKENLKIFFSESLNSSETIVVGTKDTEKTNEQIQAITKQIDSIENIIKQKEKIKTEKLIEFEFARNNFYKAYEEFIQSYNKVNAIVQAYNKVLPVAHQSFLNLEEYKAKYKVQFGMLFVDLMLNDVSVNTINTQYTDVVVSYNKLKDIDGLETFIDKSSLKKYFSEIDLVFENAQKIKFKEELIDFEKLSNQVKRIINLLEKEETYEYISAPVQPKNDLATFEVEITAKNKDVEVNNSRTFKHSEFVRRGSRIDFSMGLAGSYFSNAKVYEIYTINGQNKVGLKSENLTVPSIIAMISMTNRSSKYLAIGGSAGLGIDINNGKIQIGNFFIGPTLVLGKYDRLMFTPGVALRNVGQLKNGITINDTVLDQANDISAVITDNYKLGFFVALTYNLTKNVRDKISNYK